MLPPRPLMTWQARQPFCRTSAFASLMAFAPAVSPVEAVAHVAVHLQQGALVGGERVLPAERSRPGPAPPRTGPARAPPPRPPRSPARRGRRCSRTARPGGSPGSPAGWVRNGFSASSNPFHETAWWHIDAAIGVAQRGHPDLEHAGGHGGGLLGAELALDAVPELPLVVAPVVRPVLPGEEAEGGDQQDADEREDEPVAAPVRRGRSLFHGQILVGSWGQASHGQYRFQYGPRANRPM